jgi:hypothetical protein
MDIMKVKHSNYGSIYNFILFIKKWKIYNEISSLLTIEHFEALYDYATKESKHDALIIDNHNRVNKDLMFRKNWNTVLKNS